MISSVMARSKNSRYHKRDWPNWKHWKEPKWWRKMFKHRKRRQEWRGCMNKIRKGTDLEDMTYPKDKKPWIYFW